MDYTDDFYFCCSAEAGRSLEKGFHIVPDDCACPADGLMVTEARPAVSASLLQSVRLFLLPLDEEYAVGYSPFA